MYEEADGRLRSTVRRGSNAVGLSASGLLRYVGIVRGDTDNSSISASVNKIRFSEVVNASMSKTVGSISADTFNQIPSSTRTVFGKR